MDARRELFEFVLDQAEKQPPQKKAALYLALAEFAGDPKLTAELQACAKSIAEADKRCREFSFQFHQHDGE